MVLPAAPRPSLPLIDSNRWFWGILATVTLWNFAPHAEGRAAAAVEMEKAREAFVTATRNLTLQGASLSDRIAAELADAVRALAAQRAGQAIDALPAPFLARIAALADRVAQGMRKVTVHLHPDDLAVLQPHLSGSDLDGVTLTADARLLRGDVEVRAEGIRLADLLGAV